MTKTSLRLENWMLDALDQIAEEAEAINRSDLIRDGISHSILDHEDEAPDWAVSESVHDRKRRRNRAKLREMHFKQRTFEYCRDALFDHNGNMKEYPPSPERLRQRYGEMLREEVKEEYHGERDEYMDHVNEILDWYELMHPAGDHGGPSEQAVELAGHHMKHDNNERAREVARRASNHAKLTEHEILDKARKVKANAEWRHDWDKATRPHMEGEL